MTRTPSNMIPLGTSASEFALKDAISGRIIRLKDYKGEHATVIFFICNHCPYVKHINDELVRLAKDYDSKGVSFIAISSNDVDSYPDDSPENMKKIAENQGYPFPYLYDETQEVAKAYHAACTPDFYIFDNGLSLVYRGQLDDSRPGNNIPSDGRSVRNALDQAIKGEPISGEQKPSLGCNIKWRD